MSASGASEVRTMILAAIQQAHVVVDKALTIADSGWAIGAVLTRVTAIESPSETGYCGGRTIANARSRRASGDLVGGPPVGPESLTSSLVRKTSPWIGRLDRQCTVTRGEYGAYGQTWRDEKALFCKVFCEIQLKTGLPRKLLDTEEVISSILIPPTIENVDTI